MPASIRDLPSRRFSLVGIGLLMLASLPVVHAQPTATPEPFVSEGRRFTEKDGASLFRGLCAGCHMPAGQGVKTGAGFYPALAGNPKLAAGTYPAVVVLNGYKAMPAFKGMLTDDQVADVVNYVRTNLGNHYTDPITAADVKPLR